MTPAIKAAIERDIVHKVHQYHHDASAESYGLEAAQKLGVPQARVFKTLVAKLDAKELVVGVVPVSSTLNMKQMAKALGGKKAAMAPAVEVERSTGYVLGGVSPLGQRKPLRTVIDRSAKDFATMFVSAGRRGLEVELHPDDLCRLTNGSFADISG